MELNFENAQNLTQLESLLEQIQVKNGWNKPTPSLYPFPKQNFIPAHWSYQQAKYALDAAGRLVGTEWAERRNLILANPIQGNDYPTVPTLVAAYQMVKGGESARSHRHTPNAMRIIIEAAKDTFTVVEGTNVPMEPGDVLLTPNWFYHGHDNRSPEKAYWIDILDAPLVHLLGPMFFEAHPEHLEKTERTEPDNPMRFAFKDYYPKLLDATEFVPGVKKLKLGPPEIKTFDQVVVLLTAGANYQVCAHTANEIYVVVRGKGKSLIGGKEFEWQVA